MARAALGKRYRKGMMLFDVVDKFRDNKKASAWLEEFRCLNDRIVCSAARSIFSQTSSTRP